MRTQLELVFLLYKKKGKDRSLRLKPLFYKRVSKGERRDSINFLHTYYWSSIPYLCTIKTSL